MRIQDLGELRGPVLLFGGAVSNLQATRTVLDVAATQGIPAARCIFTGDATGYCADPYDTLALLHGAGVNAIAGNMERQLAAGAGVCGCGFETGSACDLMARRWFAHVSEELAEHLTKAPCAWMADLPDWITFSHGGRSHVVVHGGGTDIAAFVWPVSPRSVFAEEWDAIERQVGPVDVVIAGHCGLPFIQEFSFGTWINTGAIGMPPHDGDPRSSYALLGAEGPEICRLSYDHGAAAAAMRAAGPGGDDGAPGYDRALEAGYWPSEEVLPPALRRRAMAPASASG